jgi:tRNA pseudouridine13 synthase
LSERVKTGTWNRALPGDLLVSAADGSLTHADQPDENTQKALDHMDIHPTGPMWGRGRHPVSGLAATLEADALAPCGEWLNALEHVGLQQERRALRLRVKQLRWTFEGRDRLYLQFSLGPGAYATSVLREVTRYVEYRTAIHPPDTT